ncbi:MAG: bifunctional adenosylcobinamide kinase/adenosylcobinamide-phosphate guanylyltransferase [Kangiellaceae bacterium]
MIKLILGGARSGKSSFAENIAKTNHKNVCYIATATAGDNEMADRIAHHQSTRPKHWDLMEEPFYLSQSMRNLENFRGTVLIDCVTLWLSNWICLVDQEPNKLNDWQDERQNFLDALVTSRSKVIIVSNEVGSGIVPMGELTRQFADNAGWLNQNLAEIADQVTLVVAGLPLLLKENNHHVQGGEQKC